MHVGLEGWGLVGRLLAKLFRLDCCSLPMMNCLSRFFGVSLGLFGKGAGGA